MGRRFPERRSAGELESEILGVLWAAQTPLVPGQVRDALSDDESRGPAYTTVLTTLTRLYEKGVVTREPAGRAHAYQPVLDEAGIIARQMRVVMDRGGDRTAALRRFLSELSSADAAILAAALRETGSPDGTPADGSFTDGTSAHGTSADRTPADGNSAAAPPPRTELASPASQPVA